MSDLNIASVLSQIRSLREQAGAVRTGLPAPPQAGAPAASGMPGFSELLKGALDGVNKAQSESSQLQQAFQLGDPRADLPSVMLSMQKSSVSFRALVEVRNRVVQAYQDVMNMPM